MQLINGTIVRQTAIDEPSIMTSMTVKTRQLMSCLLWPLPAVMNKWTSCWLHGRGM